MTAFWPEPRHVAAAILLPDTCPDPDGHERLMALREQTWREPRCPNPYRCEWCDGVKS